MIRMGKIFASVILICLPVFAQSNIMVYSGITSTQIFIENVTAPSKFADWHRGVNFGVESDFRFASAFYISPTFEYSSFGFDKTKPQSYLDIFDGNTIVSVNGENLKDYRLGVDIKLIQAEPHVLRLIMHTGISYLIESPVNITTVSKNLNGEFSSNTRTIGKSNYFVHTFGIGFIADIKKPLGLFFEGQYYSNYSNSLRFSLNGGIVYNFPN
jgi:hypothetical protein